MAEHPETSQNDLLCKLKLSLDTIFHQETTPLDKLGKLVEIAFNPLPPGSCDSGINNKPLNSGYVLLNQEDFFNSRIYDLKPSETLNRIDVKFSYISNIIYCDEDDERVDPTNIIGHMTGDGIGIDFPKKPELRIWKFNSQITLNRGKLFNKKQDEEFLKNLVTVRTYLASTVYDSSSQKYINKNVNEVQIGSDDLFYYLREIPTINYEPNSKLLQDKSIFEKYFVYKLEVYEKWDHAMRARLNGYKINKNNKNGEVEILQLPN